MSHPEYLGHYRIIQELARGGQGVVYKAQHQRLKHLVAIKVLLDLEAEGLKRFKQEARILASIKHPNLLPVVDLGDFAGARGELYPYMAMEYIEGADLKDISRKGIPEFDWSTMVISTIAEVLNHIHQYGIIHRDLKPANILIENGTGRPILIDFGLVKRDPKKMALGSLDFSKMSTSGEIMGTPSYMAPEQVESSLGKIGPWTDVYGLAATYYHLLTGQPPYQGPPISIYSKIMGNAPSPDPRSINPDIPDYLAEAILSAMQKDWAQRPPTTLDFKRLLQPPKPSRRRFKYLGPALLGTGLGFAGLVAYFVNKGIPRHQAIQLAHEEVKQIVPSKTPSAEFLETLDSVQTDAHDGRYTKVIESCNVAIPKFQGHPRIFEFYTFRGIGYFYAGEGIIKGHGEADRATEAKEFLLKSRDDLNLALLAPSNLMNDQYRADIKGFLETIDQYLSSLKRNPYRAIRRRGYTQVDF